MNIMLPTVEGVQGWLAINISLGHGSILLESSVEKTVSKSFF